MELPHGTEMLTAMMIDAALKRGFEVELFTAYYSPASRWKTFLEERRVAIHEPGFWFLTRYHLPHRMLARRLWKRCAAERPLLVWSADNEPFACRALEAMPEHAPPFFVHDPSAGTPEVPYERLWFSVCNRVTGLSTSGSKQASAARSYYKLSKPVEAVWLASFPPRRAVAPLSVERPLRFAQFGRLHPVKNPLLTLEAFARLAASGLQAELHFFGDGPLREKCRLLAEQLSLGGAVTFHGAYSHEELDDLIESIDVGLMPSKFEGFGIVMLELISRGRPVIATDVGGAREVLEGMGCGWVIKKSDAGDLFTAMTHCCKERAEVAERGNTCRSRWLEHFTPEKMFDRMAGFWRSCGVPVPDYKN